jgi:hypothetical protein
MDGLKEEAILDGATCYSTPLGRVETSTPSPGVVLLRYVGFAQNALFDPASQTLINALASNPQASLFVDAEQLTNYDSDFRVKWTAWFVPNQERVESFHFLHKSGFVKMGMQMLNIAIGGIIRAYSDKAPFEAALRARLVNR